MLVPVNWPLRRADIFISRLFKVVASPTSLLGIALLTCMPNVGAWRRLGECSTRCHCTMWSPAPQ